MLALLDQPLPAQTVRMRLSSVSSFEREIRLRDVGFSYASGQPQILRGINLRLEKGQRVGFIGVTGNWEEHPA